MGSLIQEIKRRKVFRVTAVYAVVAWVLIQVADTIAPMMNLPDSAPRLVLFLLIILFPIALFLAWAYEVTPDGIRADMGDSSLQNINQGTDRKLIYVILVLVLLVAGFQVTDRLFAPDLGISSIERSSPIAGTDLQRLIVDFGETQRFPNYLGYQVMFDLSKDGRRLVYATYDTGSFRLYVRDLDTLEPQLLLEKQFSQENAFGVMSLSPDGEMLAYKNDMTSEIFVLQLSNGQERFLSDVHSNSGVYWGEDQRIYYTDQFGKLNSISRTASEPEVLDIPQGNLVEVHTNAHPLPETSALLYVSNYGDRGGSPQVKLYDKETKQVLTITDNGSNPRYVQSGHILFVRSSTLWAIPFDVNLFEVTGPEAPMLELFELDRRIYAGYSVANNGALIYQQLENSRPTAPIWANNDGSETELDGDYGNFGFPQISPDGSKVAMNRDGDIWIYDIVRSTLSQVTFTGSTQRPIWSPDGETIVTQDTVQFGLGNVAANGVGRYERFNESTIDQRPETFSPDGSVIVYRVTSASGTFDLYSMSVNDKTEIQLTSTPTISEGFSKISPNGNWIAYSSDETGSMEVYVRPFPNFDDNKWLISNAGGQEPSWSPDGNTLYYRSNDGEAMMHVNLDVSNGFNAGRPTVLFTGFYSGIGGRPSYDIHPDGDRFLMRKPQYDIDERVSNSLVLVNNWFTELQRLAPSN